MSLSVLVEFLKLAEKRIGKALIQVISNGSVEAEYFIWVLFRYCLVQVVEKVLRAIRWQSEMRAAIVCRESLGQTERLIDQVSQYRNESNLVLSSLHFTCIIDECIEVSKHLQNSLTGGVPLLFHEQRQLGTADLEIAEIKLIWYIPTDGAVFLSALQNCVEIHQTKEHIFVEIGVFAGLSALHQQLV